MMNFIQTSGLFFWPILCMLILVSGLGVRYTRELKRDPNDPSLGGRINGLLFWGAIAAVLGVLGQSVGIYNGLQAISLATEISPQVVMAGLAQSFQTTFFGIGVLLVAGLIWGVLKGVLPRAGQRVGGVRIR